MSEYKKEPPELSEIIKIRLEMMWITQELNYPPICLARFEEAAQNILSSVRKLKEIKKK